MRVGVSVPATLTTQIPATEVLDRVLAVTGGRGGGSATFAQGGGTNGDDLSHIESRIWAALGALPDDAKRELRGAAAPHQAGDLVPVHVVGGGLGQRHRDPETP
jgi:hypothetical protein